MKRRPEHCVPVAFACSLCSFLPTLQRETLNGTEYLAAQIRIGPAHVVQQLLDLVPAAAAILRAGVFHNGKLQRVCEICDAPFAGVEHRADLPYARAAHMRDRLKAADAPLIYEREQEGLHCVVKVMAEGELRDAAGTQRIAQRAAPHLGAEGAGIVLLAHVEDDLLDVCFQARIRHVQFAAEVFHRGEIHALEPQLDRDRLEMERLWIVGAQVIQRHEQHERVLAAGYAQDLLIHFSSVMTHIILFYDF